MHSASHIYRDHNIKISVITDLVYIRVNDKSFEYDVYSLVKAFYPLRDISLYREGRGVDEADIWLNVNIDENTIALVLLGCKRPRVSAGVTGLPRKEVKNVLKRLLYGELSEVSGRTLPWGTLTGVRPIKIAYGMLESADEQIFRYMRDTYLSSDEKIKLAISIAKRERALLSGVERDDAYSLYIGIPFCPSICLYCSFSSSPISEWRSRTDEYIDALIHEIRACRDMFSGRAISTIYIGGGTPTSLSEEQLERLLCEVEKNFDTKKALEYTVEAGRPDSITEEKLAVLRKYGVDRISVNPQTMNDATLRLIGRAHTAEDTIRAYELSRASGFKTINMDLITGLPGETAKEVKKTADAIMRLSPDAVTVHSLAIKRSSRLKIEWDRYESELMENSQEIMDILKRAADTIGMSPYYLYRQKNMAGNLENTGYARDGHEGLYNILIMEERQDILALGAGADSKRIARSSDETGEKTVLDHTKKVQRCENVKDIDSYIRRTDEMIDRKRRLFRVAHP